MILVLTICAALQCEQQRIPLLSEVTPFMCALKAQEKAAEALGLYGEPYRLTRYSCERRK